MENLSNFRLKSDNLANFIKNVDDLIERADRPNSEKLKAGSLIKDADGIITCVIRAEGILINQEAWLDAFLSNSNPFVVMFFNNNSVLVYYFKRE